MFELDLNNNWLKLTPAHLTEYSAYNLGFIFDKHFYRAACNADAV